MDDPMQHQNVLDTIKAKAPAEWNRIRPRIMIDMDGDEVVQGIRDIVFVARADRNRIIEAINGGSLGIPRLIAHRAPARTGSPNSFYWWCYLSDILNWRRAYAGKPDGYTPTANTDSLAPLHNHTTTTRQRL